MGFLQDLLSDSVVNVDEEIKKTLYDYEYGHIGYDECWRRLHNVSLDEVQIKMKMAKYIQVEE